LVTSTSWWVLAGDKEQAKQLFDAGLKLMRLDDFAGASANFERSVALYPTQNSLFNLANCYKAMQRYGDALNVLARLRRQFGDKLKPEIKEATDRQEREIQSLVARLTIRTVPTDAMVKIDGRELGTGLTLGALMLGPGDHQIEATRPGYQDVRRSIQLVSGAEVTETLSLVAAPGDLAKGADVNAKIDWTALMVASFRGHLDVVQVLLDKGADVNAKMDSGGTALDAATNGGHADVRALLVKAGAKSGTSHRYIR